ncbi:hypothetical protein ACFX5K_00705 [Rickettsiales bacterium LUAb2]
MENNTKKFPTIKVTVAVVLVIVIILGIYLYRENYVSINKGTIKEKIDNTGDKLKSTID